MCTACSACIQTRRRRKSPRFVQPRTHCAYVLWVLQFVRHVFPDFLVLVVRYFSPDFLVLVVRYFPRFFSTRSYIHHAVMIAQLVKRTYHIGVSSHLDTLCPKLHSGAINRCNGYTKDVPNFAIQGTHAARGDTARTFWMPVASAWSKTVNRK
jgi:hypothetical protein